MTNPVEKQPMRVLDKLATFAYVTQSPLLPLCIFKSLKWSIDRGLSEFSPPAFATTGLIFCSKLLVSKIVGIKDIPEERIQFLTFPLLCNRTWKVASNTEKWLFR